MPINANHFVQETHRTARGVVGEMLPKLLSAKTTDSWSNDIADKVASIVSKEIVPLLPADQAFRRQQIIVSGIGRILSIAYLADYALEKGFAFRIEAATEAVVIIALSMGAQEQYVREKLRPMRALYDAELGRVRGMSNAIHQANRYLMKSADVVFVQLLALHVLGIVVNTKEEDALRFAGAALDVYDDLVDKDEDDEQTGNPFVISTDETTDMPTMFLSLAGPYISAVSNYIATNRGGIVRAYCAGVIRRLSEIQRSRHVFIAGV